MGMADIRKARNVPAKRGMRVRYTGGRRGPVEGTILSARGGYLMIRLDGTRNALPFHPTWELVYLSGSAEGTARRDARLAARGQE